MRILIDIGHPADVHLYKNFAQEMINRGHSVLITAREKEMSVYLLNVFDLPFFSMGKVYKSIPGKIWGMIKFSSILLKKALKFQPDIFMSHSSVYASITSFLLRKKHICTEDTGNMEQVGIAKILGGIFLTSDSFGKDLGKRHIKYPGYHELAYLHPNRFNFDESKSKEYILVRFVSWNSSHDIADHGLSLNEKKELIEKLKNYGQIIISSESALPKELEPYKYRGKPEELHGLLTKCKLIIGESATLCAEGAVLGVPGVYIANQWLFYTNELESKYQLVCNFKTKDFKKALAKATTILAENGSIKEFENRRQKLLSEKIDVTQYLIDFVEDRKYNQPIG